MLQQAVGYTREGRSTSSRSSWAGGGLNIAFTAGRELRRWQGTMAVREVRDRLLALMAEA